MVSDPRPTGLTLFGDPDGESGDLLDPLAAAPDAFAEDLLDSYALPRPPQLAVTPRPYQQTAVAEWLANGGRGIVVLPTGAGKTVVAFLALSRVPVRTLVVVPTIELLRQWQTGLREVAGLPAGSVGAIGGGERTSRPVTVITYDSAARPRRDLAGYGLLIVDEVHHLPAPSYRSIVDRVNAPWRLGLSATVERADGGHEDLDDLIGPEVFRRQPADLAQSGHIANYRERRVYVDLSPEERFRYDALMAEWKWYLATQRSRFRRGDFFAELIHRSAYDPAARRALQAQHQARLIALNAEGKVRQVETLLAKHHRERVLIFSEYTSMVGAISRRLAIPAITYRTDPLERRLILERFRSGRYTKLVAGRVLNEGVDVPDASVAIVVSGNSTTREHIQRLGRVLRPKARGAVLYEIISRRTTEGKASRARRKAS